MVIVMLEHIIKNGETIEDILEMYHLELEELRNVNLHITDFFHLASGMKIKVPLLSNEVEQILENTESFVQKYYPKINEVLEEKKEEAVVVKKEEKALPTLENRRAYPGILPPSFKGNLKKI